MKIEINYRVVRKLWKMALEKPENRDAWIAVQTIMALAGKECNSWIKEMLEVTK